MQRCIFFVKSALTESTWMLKAFLSKFHKNNFEMFSSTFNALFDA